MIEIREAVCKKDIKKFVDFPQKLYKDCPYFVPFLRFDEINNADPKKNPALEDCRSRYFLAYRGGEIVGRVMAIIHYADIKKSGIKRIRFSRIDFIDDYEVSAALIKTVEDLGRKEGLEHIHGPLGFNDLDREGLLIEGFERRATFETQYSYPYYQKHIEGLGFQKDVDWVERVYRCPPQPDQRIEKISQMVLKRHNLKSVDLNKKQFIERYGKKFFTMIDQSYSGLYASVPLSDKVIDATIGMFKFIADMRLICCIVDENDNVVGGGIALPGIAKAIQKSRGRLTPCGIIRFLYATKHYDTVDFVLIGVLPQYLNKGVNAIVVSKILNGGIERGVKYGESNPTLETNFNVQSQFKFLEIAWQKRRRAYTKAIPAKPEA